MTEVRGSPVKTEVEVAPDLRMTLEEDRRPGARIKVVGVDTANTDSSGYAMVYVPDKACYAVDVAFEGHHEILYEEILSPGGRYEYRPGPVVTAEEHYKAGVRALALTQESESKYS